MKALSKTLISLMIMLGISSFVCMCLFLYGDLERLKYLWFEIPLIQSAIKDMQGISIAKVYDQGPPDEFHILVTIEIEGKGQLILANPRYESFVREKPVVVAYIGSCYIPGAETLAIMPLKQAISSYEQIHRIALEKYGQKFATCK